MKTRRLFRNILFATMVSCGLFGWLIFGFPDHFLPTHPPTTPVERTLNYAAGVGLWPLTVFAARTGEDPPLLLALLLIAAAGLFWGLTLELLLLARHGRSA